MVREGSLAAWPGMPETRFNQSFSLAQEATSLELHGVSSPVFGDGGNANASDASPAADMGTCDLPDRVHVNRVESFNGYMRRAFTGVFHSTSVTHLGRHTSEATFR